MRQKKDKGPADQATTMTVATATGPATVIKLRMTKWQVVGQVLVAFLGLCAAALGIWAGTRSEGTVDRLDGDVIPTVQKRVDELQTDNKTLANAVKKLDAEADALRDRVSRLEGALGHPHRPGWIFSGASPSATAGAKGKKKLDKILTRRRVEIPTMQQAVR
jgi:cell division protein FtsB